MKLLWLVGIEGSGHHMIRDVLCDFLASRAVIDKRTYYPLWLQRWDGEQEPLPRQAVRNVLEEVLREYQSAGCTHLYEDTSFPSGGDASWSGCELWLTAPLRVEFWHPRQGFKNVAVGEAHGSSSQGSGHPGRDARISRSPRTSRTPAGVSVLSMTRSVGFTHGYYLYPLPGIEISDLQTVSGKETERQLLDADAWRGTEEPFATCISEKEHRGASRSKLAGEIYH